MTPAPARQATRARATRTSRWTRRTARLRRATPRATRRPPPARSPTPTASSSPAASGPTRTPERWTCAGRDAREGNEPRVRAEEARLRLRDDVQRGPHSHGGDRRRAALRGPRLRDLELHRRARHRDGRRRGREHAAGRDRAHERDDDRGLRVPRLRDHDDEPDERRGARPVVFERRLPARHDHGSRGDQCVRRRRGARGGSERAGGAERAGGQCARTYDVPRRRQRRRGRRPQLGQPGHPGARGRRWWRRRQGQRLWRDGRQRNRGHEWGRCDGRGRSRLDGVDLGPLVLPGGTGRSPREAAAPPETARLLAAEAARAAAAAQAGRAVEPGDRASASRRMPRS